MKTRKSLLVFCQRHDFDLEYTRFAIENRNHMCGFDALARSQFTSNPHEALQIIQDACKQNVDEVFLLSGLIFEMEYREFWDGGLAVRAKEAAQNSNTLVYTAVCTASPIRDEERKLFNLIFEKKAVPTQRMIDYILQLMHPQWTQQSKDALLGGFP